MASSPQLTIATIEEVFDQVSVADNADVPLKIVLDGEGIWLEEPAVADVKWSTFVPCDFGDKKPNVSTMEMIEVDLGRDHGEWIIHQMEDMSLYPVSNEKQRYPGERIRCHIMFRELLDESEKDRMKENNARLDAIEWCMDICEDRDRNAWDFNAKMREDPDYPSPVRSWKWFATTDYNLVEQFTLSLELASVQQSIMYPSEYASDYYRDFLEWELEEALVKFEQDYDYEKWLEEEVEPIVMKENLMRVESLDIEERAKSRDARNGLGGRIWQNKTGWVGELHARVGESVNFMMDGWKELGLCPTLIKHVHQGQVGYNLVKDRYFTEVQIVKNGLFAKSPYGMVYIPPKLRRYLVPNGCYMHITYGKTTHPGGPKEKTPFTAIYVPKSTFSHCYWNKSV
jgi:hypothetical protein